MKAEINFTKLLQKTQMFQRVAIGAKRCHPVSLTIPEVWLSFNAILYAVCQKDHPKSTDTKVSLKILV
jgi:hypothetical protein